ncbi:MAG: metallophosphoesterase [Clostridia bacterium]|nr:metallophosphoesterase [Clostridia bacterium]
MLSSETIRRFILEAKARIEILRHDDSLIMPLFTDLHTPSPDHESTLLLTELLSDLTREVPCDAVLNLGDLLDMLGRSRHIPTDELTVFFNALLEKLDNAAACPLLCVPGNHDAVGTDFFHPAYWNAIVKHRFANAAAAYDESGSYFYLDFDRADTRFIVLSTPCASDIEAEFPTQIWRFGDNQLRWLENTALDTNKHVILLMHAPFFSEYRGSMTSTLGVWTGTRAAVSYIYALCGRIEEAEAASAILSRFHEKTGRLTACLSGHTHADSLHAPLEEKNGFRNPLPCPQAVTRSFTHPRSGERHCGFAMDVLVWTPSAHRLDLVRIGDGEDRRIL